MYAHNYTHVTLAVACRNFTFADFIIENIMYSTCLMNMIRTRRSNHLAGANFTERIVVTEIGAIWMVLVDFISQGFEKFRVWYYEGLVVLD